MIFVRSETTQDGPWLEVLVFDEKEVQKKRKKDRQTERSKHIKGAKERYLSGQDKTSKFSGQSFGFFSMDQKNEKN